MQILFNIKRMGWWFIILFHYVIKDDQYKSVRVCGGIVMVFLCFFVDWPIEANTSHLDFFKWKYSIVALEL